MESQAVHEHKVRSVRKGGFAFVGRIWQQLWSIDALDGLPLMLAFATVAGASFYFMAPRDPTLWEIGAAISAGGSALWLARKLWRVPLLYVLAIVMCGIIFGVSMGAMRTWRVATPTLTEPMGPVMLEGWVKEIEPGNKGVRVRLKVHAIAGGDIARMPETVRLTHTARLVAEPGRFVRCWAVLRPPPAPQLPGDYDFQRQAYYEGLGAVGYVQGRCRGGALGRPEGFWSNRKRDLATFRRRLAAHVNEAAGERAGGFAAALISGDRSYMRKEDREALRGSGLAHLLAISGLHMGIVGGLAFFLLRKSLALIEPLALRFPVQKLAAGGALSASLLYLIISGASVSTQRAFIMSAVVFGAVLFDRAAISLRSYAIAMLAVVTLQPESVMSPGFQMSFAASGALIATYEAWSKRRKGQGGIVSSTIFTVQSLVVTSFVAAVATAPFAFYHFDRVAGLGLLANVLAMPVISFVSAPSAALALILAPFGLADIGLMIFGKSLELVLAIAHWCDGLAPRDFVPGKAMPAASVVLFSIALALAIVGRGWVRLLLSIAPVSAAVALWLASTPPILHWSASGDVYVNSTSEGVVAATFADGGGLSPLRYIDMETSRDCSEAGCRIETSEGIVLLSDTQEGERLCLSKETYAAVLSLSQAMPAFTRAQHCAPVYSWSDIEKQGALTLKSTPTGLVSVPPKQCGSRAWRSCR